ncbi:Hypothetical protein, putative [Bodo saltans]|uniref:Uncharacterized protein n=1 Tax=Bodo saltans TaxID=75058 RepID=A0A0S4J453_BODSA|nr:Hypothetical protein, putative [Bodo saltans]|eukprot:CUG80406.1 Hypothetical protein, putative [Bodo saltans]
MLPKNIVKSFWRPTVKCTAFVAPPAAVIATPTASSRTQPTLHSSMRQQTTSATGSASPSTIPLVPLARGGYFAQDPADKVMPTQFIIPEVQEKVDCGTGQPAQRGSRKPVVWMRRKPWFDRQWSLDMKRTTKGPATPFFPEGVPFTPIRKLQSFAGRSFKVNAGRRRKIRLSLKRGRRKLL